MADALYLKAGNKAGLPDLQDREMAYVRDENALYIGTPAGNRKIGEELETAIKELREELEDKLTASPVALQQDISADADLAAVVSAFNSLLAAMKASGIMST